MDLHVAMNKVVLLYAMERGKIVFVGKFSY